jgi:hypothetical protein
MDHWFQEYESSTRILNIFTNYVWHTIAYYLTFTNILKLVVCILLRVLGQVQGFRLTQHWFEYFIIFST